MIGSDPESIPENMEILEQEGWFNPIILVMEEREDGEKTAEI